MTKYRIIFHLEIDAKNLLDDLEIDYTIKDIFQNSEQYQFKDRYCVVIKYCKNLSLNLSDDNLCSKLLGNDFNEYLVYTNRVY